MPQEPLSPGQIEFYHENGFVVLGPLFDEAELGSLRRAADELVEKSGPVVVGNPRLEIEKERLDGGMVIRKIEPVIDVVPALKDLVYDQRMTAPTAQLFGEEVILFEDKLNYKPPRIGSAYPLHQDYAYWQDYTDQLITVILLLDDAVCPACGGSSRSMLPSAPPAADACASSPAWDLLPFYLVRCRHTEAMWTINPTYRFPLKIGASFGTKPGHVPLGISMSQTCQ